MSRTWLVPLVHGMKLGSAQSWYICMDIGCSGESVGTSVGMGCEMNWEISSGAYILLCIKLDFSGGSGIKNLSASAGEVGDVGVIPESERSPGEGSGNPLRYS